MLWKAAFGFNEFFLKSLSVHLPISWWVIYNHNCPHHAECSAVFDKKMAWSPCPPLRIHSILPQSTFSFCFPGWKKSSKGNTLLMWKRWNKNSRSTKRHQNWLIQTLFWAVGKKVLIYCIKWRVFWRWLKFKCVRINTQFLISKFCFFGSPS